MKTIIIKFKNPIGDQHGSTAKRHQLIIGWFGTDYILNPVDLDDRTCEVTWCHPTRDTGYKRPLFVFGFDLSKEVERVRKHFGKDEILYIGETNVPHDMMVLNTIKWICYAVLGLLAFVTMIKILLT